MESRSVADSRSVLVQWMGPGHANSAGFVHGGQLMRLIDEAAALAAVRHSGERVVTAAADRMTFLLPIHVGQLVTLRASVNAAWRTSVEVGVRVEAESPRTGARGHTNTAYLTLVAVDDEGHPKPVPPLAPESADERRREQDAQLRRANRLAEREQLLRARSLEGP